MPTPTPTHKSAPPTQTPTPKPTHTYARGLNSQCHVPVSRPGIVPKHARASRSNIVSPFLGHTRKQTHATTTLQAYCHRVGKTAPARTSTRTRTCTMSVAIEKHFILHAVWQATFARQLASGNVNGCTSVCCNDKPMICSTGDLCRGEAREGAEGEREAGGARLARSDDVSLKDAHGACSRVEVALPAKQGSNAVADCDASQRLTTAGPKFTVSRWHRRDGAVQAKSLGMGGQQFGRRRGFGALLNRICVGKFGGKRKSRETNRFI
jgi:hypothetical protein